MQPPFVALDLETTGLNADRDEIIEIAAVRFADGRVLGEFSSLVRPIVDVPVRVTQLTGLGAADLRRAPAIGEVVVRLAEFAGTAPLVGHSVGQDLRFLRRQGFSTGGTAFDTFELASILVPESKRYTLGQLMTTLGLAEQVSGLPAHRALADAHAHRLLFEALFERACQLDPVSLAAINRLSVQLERSGVASLMAPLPPLESMSPATSPEASAVATSGSWPLAAVFRAAAKERAQRDAAALESPAARSAVVKSSVATVRSSAASAKSSAATAKSSTAIAQATALPAPARLTRPTPLVPQPDPVPLDLDALDRLLAPEGGLAGVLAGFEDRPCQRAMMRAVGEAFRWQGKLIVEAGTGTGKSLAYLLPAAAWAVAHGQPVVVATHTITLQEQLVQHDIPIVARLLGTDVKAAVLKGRANYLCRSRLEALLIRDDLDVDAVRAAAKFLVWQPITETGDRSELLLQPEEERAWRLVCAEGDACTPERCRYAAQGQCWVQRARARAEAAHIIVVNHALLMSDILVDNRLLPAHRSLLVDEAHQLEDVATGTLGFEASEHRIRDALAAFETSGGRGGVLARLDAAVAGAHLRENRRASLAESLAAMRSGVQQAGAGTRTLFARLADFMAENARKGIQNAEVRLTEATRSQPAWLEVEVAWDNLARHLNVILSEQGRVLAHLEAVADAINATAFPGEGAGTGGKAGSGGGPGKHKGRSGSGDRLEVGRHNGTADGDRRQDGQADGAAKPGQLLMADLIAAVREVSVLIEGMTSVISNPGANDITWAGRGGAEKLVLRRAPLFVGDILARQLFREKDTVVLTSATLRAGDSFEFIQRRLGLPEAETKVVDSPFDYASATLLMVPTDLPEPNQTGYQAALDRLLITLGQAMGGRTLVLYTSHTGLRESYHAIRGPLGGAGIAVIGQGMDGSRHSLLDALRDPANRTMLLGTRSFWEGIDVPGEALSCLVITRLPFDVPSDPIFAARAETFDEPFFEYSIPQAIMRFRQGFGRLIRQATDRGVVVVLDSRVRTKSYGSQFLDALPPCRRYLGPLDTLPDAARRFMGGEAVGAAERGS